MKDAMETAVASLPDPVSSAHVQAIAETILRTAKEGEQDPAILQRLALMELQHDTVRSEDFGLPFDLRSVERNDCSSPGLMHAVVAWMCPPEGWKCL